MERGTLATCSLERSIERFLQLNLNVPLQGQDRPAWQTADPAIGCRVPHYDFHAVVRTLHLDPGRIVTAIRQTAEATDPRIVRVDVAVDDVRDDDPMRTSDSGVRYAGVVKRVVIRCERTDGERQTLEYVVAFGGSGPVFDDEQA